MEWYLKQFLGSTQKCGLFQSRQSTTFFTRKASFKWRGTMKNFHSQTFTCLLAEGKRVYWNAHWLFSAFKMRCCNEMNLGPILMDHPRLHKDANIEFIRLRASALEGGSITLSDAMASTYRMILSMRLCWNQVSKIDWLFATSSTVSSCYRGQSIHHFSMNVSWNLAWSPTLYWLNTRANSSTNGVGTWLEGGRDLIWS